LPRSPADSPEREDRLSRPGDPMTCAALDGRFTLSQPEREAKLLSDLAELTEHHYESCPPYARILDAVDGSSSPRAYTHCSELPWLPVRMFKHHTLKSIPDEE